MKMKIYTSISFASLFALANASDIKAIHHHTDLDIHDKYAGLVANGSNPCLKRINAVFRCIGTPATECVLDTTVADPTSATCLDYTSGSEFTNAIWICMDVVEAYGLDCGEEISSAERCIHGCVYATDMPCRGVVDNAFNCLGEEISECFYTNTMLELDANCRDFKSGFNNWISYCMDRHEPENYCAEQVQDAEMCITACTANFKPNISTLPHTQ